MIVAFTAIAILSVIALYAYEAHQTSQRHKADPIRTGREPEFARLGEHDWYEVALTSADWARR